MANSLIKALFMSNLSIYILSLFKILPECGIFYPVLLSTLAWACKASSGFTTLEINRSVGKFPFFNKLITPRKSAGKALRDPQIFNSF